MKTMSSGAGAMFMKKEFRSRSCIIFTTALPLCGWKQANWKNLSLESLPNKSVRVKCGWGCFGISVLKGEISIVLTDVSTVNCQVCNANANGVSFLYFLHKISPFSTFDLSFRNCLIPTPWYNSNKKTHILYSGNTHFMDIANLLKKFHIDSASVVQNHIKFAWRLLN